MFESSCLDMCPPHPLSWAWGVVMICEVVGVGSGHDLWGSGRGGWPWFVGFWAWSKWPWSDWTWFWPWVFVGVGVKWPWIVDVVCFLDVAGLNLNADRVCFCEPQIWCIVGIKSRGLGLSPLYSSRLWNLNSVFTMKSELW